MGKRLSQCSEERHVKEMDYLNLIRRTEVCGNGLKDLQMPSNDSKTTSIKGAQVNDLSSCCF